MDDRELRFEQLARAVVEPLRRYVVRRSGPDLADDVLADTLLVLWRRLDDVPADAALPWCYGVARGCLANAQRAESRRDRLARRAAALADRAGDDDPDPRVEEVRRAVAGLPEQEQELIRLWAWEELTPAEIAVVLGVTANAVSIRLHRARKKLAERLVERSAERPAGHGERPGPMPDRNR